MKVAHLSFANSVDMDLTALVGRVVGGVLPESSLNTYSAILLDLLKTE